MKALFDQVSQLCSKQVTESYSTSFSLATKMLDSSVRQDIYNIYGFVRFADEIVDSFHDYDKPTLFSRFETDLKNALHDKISLNPILNSFQHSFHKYQIDMALVEAFMKSMKMDLTKEEYKTQEEYKEYIWLCRRGGAYVFKSVREGKSRGLYRPKRRGYVFGICLSKSEFLKRSQGRF